MRTSIRASVTAEGALFPEAAAARPRPLPRWRLFMRHRAALAGLVILALLFGLALAAPLVTEHDPHRQNLARALRTPSVEHPLGTDHLGRDLAARLLHGGRLSLVIGFLAVAIGLSVGVPLGAVSGFAGGLADLVIQRIADVLLSLPGFLLALSLVSMLGVGVRNVVISVGISAVPAFIRLVRASVLSVREQTYVEAARALGQARALIVTRHVLPNALAPVIVQATLSLGTAILVAAGLGFLGLGVQSPTAEWGAMLGEGRQYIFRSPMLTTLPGLAIFLAVLGFNLVGDGLRDALDPRGVRS